MQTQYQKVKEFMQAFGQECPEKPGIPSIETRLLRWALINEEGCVELDRASSRLEEFDAVLDSRYVALGTAIAYGVQEENICLSHVLEGLPLDELNTNLLKATTDSAVRFWVNHILGWVSLAEIQLGFHSWQIHEGFNEVHRSNMSKFWTPTQANLRFYQDGDIFIKPTPNSGLVVVTNQSGKVIKSPSYSPANLGPILEGKV